MYSTLIVLDKPRHLRFTFGVISDFEQAIPGGFLNLFKMSYKGENGFRILRDILYAGMKWEDISLSIPDVGGILIYNSIDLLAVWNKIFVALDYDEWTSREYIKHSEKQLSISELLNEVEKIAYGTLHLTPDQLYALTPRELNLMLEGFGEIENYRTGMICATIMNSVGGKGHGEAYQVSDFISAKKAKVMSDERDIKKLNGGVWIMATDIGELRATLTIDGKQYEMGLKEAGKQTENLDTQTANLATSIFVAQQAFVYGKEALTMFTDATINAYTEVKQFNAMTGMSIEQGGKWQDMMENMGMSLSDVTMAFRILSNNIQMAIADEGSGAAKAFKTLGVSLKDSNGFMKDSNTILLETLDALQKVGAGSQRNALAMDTLGRSYMNLNKILESTTSATDLFNQAESETTEEGLRKFDNFNNAMNKLNDTVDDTKVKIGDGLLPAFTALVTFLNTTVMPVINFLGDRLSYLGYQYANVLMLIAGKQTGEEFTKNQSWDRFLDSQKPRQISKQPTKSRLDISYEASQAAGSGTTKTKENVVRKGLDDEIQANFEAIAIYLRSIETKKALNEDYAQDKLELLKLQNEQELLINKTTNQTYKDMWKSLKANIESNPVKAFIDITAGMTIIKAGSGGGTGGTGGGGGGWVESTTEGAALWDGHPVGTYGSAMWTFMKAHYSAGKQYSEALEAWATGTPLSGVTLPRRATGGPVMAGSPYLVGERGAEIFVPNTSGNIISNSSMMHVHVDIDGNEIGSAMVDLIRLRTGAKF